jgi:hypothetical protein
MFVREKRIGPYTYVYLVETVREDGHVKQRIIRNLGRKEEVLRHVGASRFAVSITNLTIQTTRPSPVSQQRLKMPHQHRHPQYCGSPGTAAWRSVNRPG